MRGLYMGLGAIALATVNAWEYPFCEHDGCYRNLIDERFEELSGSFCVDFLSGTTTAPAAIPTEFNNCDSDIVAVSSACSCITYSLSTTSAVPTSTSSAVPSSVESTSSAVATPTSTSSYSHHPSGTPSSVSSYEHTKTTSLTTSTITTTKVYTITSCPPTVPDCPIGSVTSTVETTVTICPVTETIPPYTLTTVAPTGPVGTASYTPTKSTSSYVPVNSAVGRFAGGFEMAAAAGAIVVALL